MEQTLSDDYREALDFLYSFIDYERNSRWKYDSVHFNLDRVIDYFTTLGNPHKHGRYVHIAGTNGKGSVAAMIAKALTLSGLRTGLYTSPHLISFRERIRIDVRSIRYADVVEGVRRIRETTGRFKGLTFFEVWTALALDFFSVRDVDTAILEVGMGGRLDTTNVVTPVVSVITPISLDHCNSLGETPARIAAEKAGIIKPGVPVITAPQAPEVMDVLEKTAREAGSRLTVLGGRDITYEKHADSIDYRGVSWALDTVTVPLNGSMQVDNAALALAVLEILADEGFGITPDVARRGIESVQWPGRLQKVSDGPDVFVDGACNVEAMRRVCEFVSGKAPRDSVIAVVGMCRDKRTRDVLSVLGRCASRFVTTQVHNPRAMTADALAGEAPDGVTVTVESDPGKALDAAEILAGRNGLVIATGSLYLVGDVLKHYGIERIDEI